MDASFVTEKLVLVTGATDGIGKEVARELLRQGARVLLHGRSREKCARVADELADDVGHDVEAVLVADFASLAAVRRLAAEVHRKYAGLRVLVDNAGVYVPERRTTEDGFEQTLQVQYLAPFVLTNELVPVLRANAPSRVVVVTSTLHRGADLDLELRGPSPYEGHAAYASSKLSLTLFASELAERLRGTGVAVNAVHPGGVDTKLLRSGYGAGGVPASEGARPIVHLAASPAMGATTGRYWSRMKEAEPDRRAYDASLRRRLWERTERALEGGEREAVSSASPA